ncbi:MAG TPA: DUF3794 domain-containing protein [Firmicutes bacterium]|nr:DUF3794 domain-containing protein [Bacillota bacterium]
MDFKVINKAVAVPETLFDGLDERPVDCDFVLPDYFPDIAAVLKCTLRPVIQSKQLSGDRMLVDGVAVIQALYLDEARRCVHCCEFTKPFTSTFPVKTGAGVPCAWVSAKTDYCNCRATSPRRLDVHGAFSVRLKLLAEGGADVVSGITGDSVYTKKNVVSYSVPAASAEKTFTLNEVLELGQGKPAAEALVRSDTVPVLNDCKLLANKMIIKGDLLLKNLYIDNADTGETQLVRHEIPFSQIIDVDGLDEEWQCDMRLDVVSCDIAITQNQNGENRLLEVNVKLAACVQCFRNGMAEVVTDAYSTRCPLRLETKRLDAECLKAVRSSDSVIKETLDLPEDGVAQVMDIWCDAVPVSESCEEGHTKITGRMTIAMLAKDAQGIASYFERPGDFTLEFDDDCDAVESDIRVTDVDYSMAGAGRVEIRAELSVTRRCYASDSFMAVTSASAEEESSFPAEKAALKIYYASSGESLWEIAKACHTSMDAVIEENALPGDVLTKDAMLLVPLC